MHYLERVGALNMERLERKEKGPGNSSQWAGNDYLDRIVRGLSFMWETSFSHHYQGSIDFNTVKCTALWGCISWYSLATGMIF